VNLVQIEAFAKVAGLRSFSGAAKELLLTQPMVSTHISNLEEELGVQLLSRTTKSVDLTADGEKIYPYARQMSDLSRAIRELSRDRSPAAEDRILTIAASTVPARYLVPQILAEYSLHRPSAQFRVVESDSRGVIADITEGRADLGFVGTMRSGGLCRYTPFYQDELILVAPNTEKYRQLHKEESSLDWIRSESFVLREDGSGTRLESMKALAGAGIQEQDLKVVACFADTGAVLMSVKEGVGLSLVSRMAAQEHIERGDLLPFRLSENGAFRTLYMVTSSVRGISEPLCALMDTAAGLRGRQR